MNVVSRGKGNAVLISLGIAAVAAATTFLYKVYKDYVRSHVVRKSVSLAKCGIKIHLISIDTDVEKAINSINEAINNFPLLGLDCEWARDKDQKISSVSLLQLATPSGQAYLFRVNRLNRESLAKLNSVISRNDVLKFGVGIDGDNINLERFHGMHISSYIDLRHLVKEFSINTKWLSLDGLSQDLLNISLDKSVRRSNWNAENYSQTQVEYAAMDAYIALEILSEILQSTSRLPSTIMDLYPTNKERLLPYYSLPYKKRNLTPNGKLSKARSMSNSTRGIIPSSKKEIYGNYRLLAPDGALLCTCSKKKLDWYIYKDLGKFVDEITVQLNFEPTARPDEDDEYYLLPKENRCAVCGSSESLIRKNVVPVEYRKHFPTGLKSHRSHDTLVLCVPCHKLSNFHDHELRLKLVEMCAAPLGSELAARPKLEQRERMKARHAACALAKHMITMPQDRILELKEDIVNYFELNSPDDVTDEIIQQSIDLRTKDFKADASFKPHGLKVCQYFVTEKSGLEPLIRLWRSHFLHVMSPKFLPSCWSVEHRTKYKGHEISEEEARTHVLNGGKWQ